MAMQSEYNKNVKMSSPHMGPIFAWTTTERNNYKKELTKELCENVQFPYAKYLYGNDVENYSCIKLGALMYILEKIKWDSYEISADKIDQSEIDSEKLQDLKNKNEILVKSVYLKLTYQGQSLIFELDAMSTNRTYDSYVYMNCPVHRVVGDIWYCRIYEEDKLLIVDPYKYNNNMVLVYNYDKLNKLISNQKQEPVKNPIEDDIEFLNSIENFQISISAFMNPEQNAGGIISSLLMYVSVIMEYPEYAKYKKGLTDKIDKALITLSNKEEIDRIKLIHKDNFSISSTISVHRNDLRSDPYMRGILLISEIESFYMLNINFIPLENIKIFLNCIKTRINESM